MNRRVEPHMLRAALALVFFFLAALEGAGQTEAPVLAADADRYDFGEVLSGEVIIRKIRIHNAGKADLALSRFEFSCGCSIPRAVLSTGETVSLKKIKADDPLVLKPEAWAELELEFTSLGRKGQVVYKMVIHSNDPARPEVTLPILAKVHPAFKLKPRIVKFDPLPKRQSDSREVMITSMTGGDFKITGFSNLPPFMAYEAEKVEDDETCTYRMKLTVNATAPAGEHNLVLKALIDSEKSRGLAIPVTLTIQPDVAFMCDGRMLGNSLNFGVSKKGEEVTKRIHIINKNPGIPYTISETRLVSQYDKYIDVRLQTLRPGVEYELQVTLKPELNAPFLRGFLHLSSDHPDLENRRIILKGMFR